MQTNSTVIEKFLPTVQTNQEWLEDCADRWLDEHFCLQWDYDLDAHIAYGFRAYEVSTQTLMATVKLSDRSL